MQVITLLVLITIIIRTYCCACWETHKLGVYDELWFWILYWLNFLPFFNSKVKLNFTLKCFRFSPFSHSTQIQAAEAAISYQYKLNRVTTIYHKEHEWTKSNFTIGLKLKLFIYLLVRSVFSLAFWKGGWLPPSGWREISFFSCKGLCFTVKWHYGRTNSRFLPSSYLFIWFSLSPPLFPSNWEKFIIRKLLAFFSRGWKFVSLFFIELISLECFFFHSHLIIINNKNIERRILSHKSQNGDNGH